MSNCTMKHPNPQRGMMRSAHDMRMMEKYNPDTVRERYNSLPEKDWFAGVGAGPDERTAADMKLQQLWCPTCPPPGLRESYTQPGGSWAGVGTSWSSFQPTRDRTEFDKMQKAQGIQNGTCPNCNHALEPYAGEAPYVGPRSKFDQAMQQKWCPNCNSKEMYPDALKTFQDPDNVWSYTTQFYR